LKLWKAELTASRLFTPRILPMTLNIFREWQASIFCWKAAGAISMAAG
jgi:hypothetical protein